MANAETKTTALLFSFSAVLLLLLLLARGALLQPSPQQRRLRGALADLLLAALDRFPDGRSLLDVATRRNMILLCHAILLVILRDAGVLGAPARRRGAGAATSTATVVVAAVDAEGGPCSAPPRTRACRSVLVWRRPRNRAAATYDATGNRLVGRQRLPRGPRPAEAAASWAVPALAAVPQAEEAVATKQIVLVHKATRDHLLPNNDGESDFDRRIIVADDERNANAAAEETAGVELADDRTIEEFIANAAAEETAGVELADDRTIEEFIAKQRSMMRQESLQLAHVRVPSDNSMLASRSMEPKET